VDNRGERDIALPPSHDFEWTSTTRENHVEGRHPHINILDTVFVETVGGDLTVKIENNTESGLGIYSEPVEDKNQSLTDAEVAYARLGQLILLRIRPYREQDTRYLVFNQRTQQVSASTPWACRACNCPRTTALSSQAATTCSRASSNTLTCPPASWTTCASSACCVRPMAKTCCMCSTRRAAATMRSSPTT
jgi:hypothetical protein